MKIGNTTLHIISISAFLLILHSCSQEWLDVNTDPNYPQEIQVELVFPSTVYSLAEYYGGDYNLLGGFWAQYWAQSNSCRSYCFIDDYTMNEEDYYFVNYNKKWSKMYADVLMDLQYVIDKSEETNNMQYLLMSTVMLAFSYEFMSDLYDAIPYSEALLGDPPTSIFNPVYDDGEKIYLDLIDRINYALEKVGGIQSSFTDEAELIFQGNLDHWIRFANTLKLKMYLRMAYAKPEIAKEGIETLYETNAYFLESDAMLDIYHELYVCHNPLYHFDRFLVSVWTNLRVSEALFRYYEQNSDPRLDVVIDDFIYDNLGHSPDENGMPQGGYYISTDILDPYLTALFSINYDDPVYFISEVESYLLQAEAIARGWGVGDDKYLYDLAISSDFARKGLAGEEVSLIGMGGPYEYPSSGTFEEKLEAIAMAKWAAMAGSQGLEAFFESSRTGYPEVSSVPSWINNDYNPEYVGGKLTYSLSGVTGGVFPRRLNYPSCEVENNENFPGQTSVTDKVWWDKKTK